MTPFVILHKANDDNGGVVFIDPRTVYGICDVYGGSAIRMDIGGRIDTVSVKESASDAATAIQEVLLEYDQNERLHKFDGPCHIESIDPCFNCPAKSTGRFDITGYSDAGKV